MSEHEAVLTILNALQTRRSVECRIGGEAYLIQMDNNKGCDYLSLWRTGDRPARLGETMFDILDGVDADAVSELLRLPCIRGQSLLSRLQGGGAVWR